MRTHRFIPAQKLYKYPRLIDEINQSFVNHHSENFSLKKKKVTIKAPVRWRSWVIFLLFSCSGV